MKSYDDLDLGGARFLEVDNPLVLPSNFVVQFNVTRSDVIHSFAIPSLGLKVDAVAGILRLINFKTMKIGTHYGQCSEICGINHTYIPFCMEISTLYGFIFSMLD